jgi:pimeloyl-ACP methyl ester carboxylesterase
MAATRRDHLRDAYRRPGRSRMVSTNLSVPNPDMKTHHTAKSTRSKKPAHAKKRPGGGVGDDHPAKPAREENVPRRAEETRGRVIVFVPGIMGSLLKIKRYKGPTVTMKEDIWPPAIAGGKSIDEQFSIMMDGLSDVHDVEAGDLFPGAYNDLIARLEAKGYKVGERLFPFPYDWRLSNRVSGEGLKNFITKVIGDYNTKHPGAGISQVLVLCHSMGGIVARAAINLFGAGSLIEGVAYMASPHYGASKAFFLLHPNSGYSPTGSIVGDFVLSHAIQHVTGVPGFTDKFRERARSFQSAWELLPDRYYLDQSKLSKWLIHHKGSHHDENIFTDAQTYLDRKWKFPEAAQRSRVVQAMDFKAAIGEVDPSPATSLIIYSESEPTTPNTVTWLGGKKQKFDNITNGAGDGTVPVASARDFRDSYRKQAVAGNHSLVPNQQETFDKIVQVYGL